MFLIAVEGSLFYLVNNIYVRLKSLRNGTCCLHRLLSVLQAAEVNAVWGHPGDLKTTARIAPFYLLGVVACPLTAWCESRLLHPEGPIDRELIEYSADVTKAKDVKWPCAFAFFCFALAFLGFALSGENAGMATAL